MVPHPEPISGADYSAVELTLDDSCVLMLDQRGLPEREGYVRLSTAQEVASAIADMIVRGAPAIGISGAYGMVLAARGSRAGALERLQDAANLLIAARPTAVNLEWAVRRQLAAARDAAGTGADFVQRLAAEARAIHHEDVAACRSIGQQALAHIPAQAVILTHCNAGALATGGYGTALGVIRAAHEAGRAVRVLADETRPYLQGARLTAWELQRAGIEVEVISDSSAAHQMAQARVDCVVVGADRIAANGDFANKIGTYGLACVARVHDCPLYVAAPWSTVDLECSSGGLIPIEQRSAEELTHFNGRRIVPVGVAVDNPSFDVTPARLVSALFTERGMVSPLTASSVLALAATGTGAAVAGGSSAPGGLGVG